MLPPGPFGYLFAAFLHLFLMGFLLFLLVVLVGIAVWTAR